MKTVLLPDTEQATGNLCLKVVEEPEDRKRMLRIRTNLAFLQRSVPELAPQIVDEDADRLLMVAWEGSTFESRLAAEVYESLPWIVDAILAQLDKLQSCQAESNLLAPYKLRALRLLTRAYQHRIILPLQIHRGAFSLVIRDLPWVLSHGNLNTWNIVVDRSRRRVNLIDWEELAFRPRLHDEFSLAFHRCIPVEEMTWERSLLRRRLLAEDPVLSAGLLHPIALGCLARFYIQDVLWGRIEPGDEAKKRRTRIRYDNLTYLAEPSKWDGWLDWLLS